MKDIIDYERRKGRAWLSGLIIAWLQLLLLLL